jgi:hypothetical protein
MNIYHDVVESKNEVGCEVEVPTDVPQIVHVVLGHCSDEEFSSWVEFVGASLRYCQYYWISSVPSFDDDGDDENDVPFLGDLDLVEDFDSDLYFEQDCAAVVVVDVGHLHSLEGEGY